MFLNQKPKGAWFADLANPDYKLFKDSIKENKLNPNKDFCFQGKEDKIQYKEIASPKEMQYKDFIQDNRIEILSGMLVPPPLVGLTGAGGWESDTMFMRLDKDTNMKRNWIESIVNNILFPMFEFKFLKFTVNRSNKRDEVKEADIALKMSQTGACKRNEIREQLGLREISEEKGGEDIIGPSKTSFGSSGMGSQTANKEPHEDVADMEGVTTGEKELNLDTTKSLVKNAQFKNPNYWKRSFGATERINKSIDKQIIKKLNNKVGKINRLSKSYGSELVTLLQEYIDNIKDSLDNVIIKSFFKKAIIDPKQQKERIDALKNSFISKGKGVAFTNARLAFDYGIDAAELETGLTFAKGSLAPETLEFLESWNIELIEGAFSEVAMRAKTQIRLGLEAGESIPQIAKRLDTMKGSVEKLYKGRLETIARTETGRAVWQGSLEAYKTSGVVDKVQVLIGLGPDDARICAETYDGQEGELSKEWDVNTVPPKPHPNCKCVVIPVIE